MWWNNFCPFVVPCASVHQGSIVKMFNKSSVNKTDQDWNSNIASVETLQIKYNDQTDITVFSLSVHSHFIDASVKSHFTYHRKMFINAWIKMEIQLPAQLRVLASSPSDIGISQKFHQQESQKSNLSEHLIPAKIKKISFVCFHCPGCTDNFLQRQMQEVRFTFVTLRWARTGSFNISWCNFASRSYFSNVREFPERGYFLQFSFSVV